MGPVPAPPGRRVRGDLRRLCLHAHVQLVCMFVNVCSVFVATDVCDFVETFVSLDDYGYIGYMIVWIQN